MVALEQDQPHRVGWVRLPAPSTFKTASGYAKNAKRAMVLRHLGQFAKDIANDPAFSESETWCYAFTHVHPDVLALGTSSVGRGYTLPGSIPSDLAMQLNDEGCSYTVIDQITDDPGCYHAAPNYPTSRVDEDIMDILRKAAATPVKKKRRGSTQQSPFLSPPPLLTSPSSSSSPFSSPPPQRRLPARLMESPVASPAQEAARATILQAPLLKELAATKQALCEMTIKCNIFEGQVESLKEAAAARLLEHRDELSALEEKYAVLERDIHYLRECKLGGPSRYNLTDDYWHAAHPGAALHLFGFRSWQETLCYVSVFWPDLARPVLGCVEQARGLQITEFEMCLISKMRIRRSFCTETLAVMWEKDRTSIGRYFDTWAPKWGEAGEFCSILPLCAADLDLTCPSSYRDLNLGTVGAVPDGKDIMIDVPRDAPLIEKAAWSDKVNHAGVRTVSWSTPRGLSFEHTGLALARCPEKKLVEVWGPRLAKVPAGRPMLSDRGFAGTSRYYPNCNVQITPRFLSGRKQFRVEEVSEDRRICQLRYTCEVCFSRVTDETSLRDVVKFSYFKHLDSMNHWGHANVNLLKPLQQL